MRRSRILLASAVAVAALALSACGTEPSQGSADRTPKSDESIAVDEAAVDEESDETPADQPETELKLGETFVYTDGVEVTVSKISKISSYGEYDIGPEAGQVGFRVHWTITNGAKKPFDLDMLGVDAQGASTGGQTEIIMVDEGSKAMAGRIAAGKSGEYTAEYALDKSDGTQIVATMTRMDDEVDFLGADPNWTGAIE